MQLIRFESWLQDFFKPQVSADAETWINAFNQSCTVDKHISLKTGYE